MGGNLKPKGGLDRNGRSGGRDVGYLSYGEGLPHSKRNRKTYSPNCRVTVIKVSFRANSERRTTWVCFPGRGLPGWTSEVESTETGVVPGGDLAGRVDVGV